MQPYLRVPLQVPPGGTTPAGEAYTYSPNDTSVGDLDGDGEYELIVKWDPSNAKDNSQSGYTGNVYLDAYTLAARACGASTSAATSAPARTTRSSMVYDLDGDGRAEVACKTADGTVDGAGTVIGDPAADWRNTAGYILQGPEFLTVFNGQTGARARHRALHRAARHRRRLGRHLRQPRRPLPGRDRLSRRTAAQPGDGARLLHARRARRLELARRRAHQRLDLRHRPHRHANPYAAWRGQGNHNLSVGDVDGDGRDEIMYGAAAIDDDGTGLFTTGLGHGDAIHMSDMDPDRPGLEVFQPHESPSQYGPNALELRDARTGALDLRRPGHGRHRPRPGARRRPALPRLRDVGLGSDRRHVHRAAVDAERGPRPARRRRSRPAKPSINFGVWWDGDLLRELLDGTTITKWNWLAGNTTRAARAGRASRRTTAPRPRRASAPTSSATGAKK